MTKKSIYSTGGAVQASGGIYLTRKADIELLDLCNEGKFAYVLAPRQVGKTSLMYRTSEKLANINIRSVIVDLSSIGTRNNRNQWYCSILAMISKSLILKVDVSDWWSSRSYLTETQRLLHFFQDVVLQQVAEKLVFFFDEIDTTLEVPFSDDFFAAIRYVYNARPVVQSYNRLSFVLIGTASPGDLIKDSQRTPFNIGQRVDLKDFSFEEALPLAQGLDKSKTHAKQVLKWILDWTDGHPYLTQKLCDILSKENKTLQKRDVTAAAKLHFVGKRGKQDDNLHLVQDKLLSNPRRAELIKLYRRILEGQKISENVQSAQNQLILIGLVKAENGFLTIRNQIYQTAFDLEWVKQNTPNNWPRITATVSVVFSLLLLSIFIYNFVVASLSSQYYGDFNRSQSSLGKLENLAKLFNLHGFLTNTDYDFLARESFYSLNWNEQINLFKDPSIPPSDKQKYLIPVVEGLYVTMADVEGEPGNSDMLEIMRDSLKEVESPESLSLQNEINLWLEARDASNNQDALDKYDEVINLNPNNPATHYERALVSIQLGQYDQALVDLDTTMRLAQNISSEAAEKEIATPTQLSTPPPAQQTNTPPIISTQKSVTKTSQLSTQTPQLQVTAVTITPTELVGSPSPVTTPRPEAPLTPTDKPSREGYRSSFYSVAYIRSAINLVIQKNVGILRFDSALIANFSNLTNLREAGLIPSKLANYATQPEGPTAETMHYLFIVDASARMEKVFPGEISKWETINDAIQSRLLVGLPTRSNYGLIVLGGNRPESTRSCNQEENQLIVPMDFDNRDWVVNTIDTMGTGGVALLNDALGKAKETLLDIPQDQRKYLYLFLGGGDDCAADKWFFLKAFLESNTSLLSEVHMEIVVFPGEDEIISAVNDTQKTIDNNNLTTKITVYSPENISELDSTINVIQAQALRDILEFEPATATTAGATASAIAQLPISTPSPNCIAWAWEFNTNGDGQGWRAGQGITLEVQGGVLSGYISQPESFWGGPNNLNIDATVYQSLEMRYRVNSPEVSDRAYFYWTTADNPQFDQAKRARFDIHTDNTWQETSIDLTPMINWNGTITGIQLYPAWVSSSGVSVEYDYIRLCRNDAQGNVDNTSASGEQQQRVCSTPNQTISDNGAISNTISVRNPNILSDLDIYLNILHTYVGDLAVTLNHTGGAGPVTLIDRLSCGFPNIDVTINDEGLDGSVINQCEAETAIFGNRSVGNPTGPVLTAFDGRNFSGDWVLSISDNSRGDVGTLVEWCLIPTFQSSGNTGTIEIIKDTVPDSPQDFTFTAPDRLTPLTFNLDDNADSTLPNVQVYNNVNADTYTVSEEPVSGYINSISCIDPTGDTSTEDNNAIIDLSAGETVSCTFVSTQCQAGTFALNGTDAHSGAAGNIKTFTLNGINVNVSGWSRNKTTGITTPAYVGAYPNGLGVTDLVSDGNGSNNQHDLDNSGEDNYLLFEFDRPVIINQIHLGFTTINSDIMVWYGNAPSEVDPYSAHQTLNLDFLNSLTFEAYSSIISGWVNINEGNQTGNILVIAPKIDDSNDYFKVDSVDISCSN